MFKFVLPKHTETNTTGFGPRMSFVVKQMMSLFQAVSFNHFFLHEGVEEISHTDTISLSTINLSTVMDENDCTQSSH